MDPLHFREPNPVERSRERSSRCSVCRFLAVLPQVSCDILGTYQGHTCYILAGSLLLPCLILAGLLLDSCSFLAGSLLKPCLSLAPRCLFRRSRAHISRSSRSCRGHAWFLSLLHQLLKSTQYESGQSATFRTISDVADFVIWMTATNLLASSSNPGLRFSFLRALSSVRIHTRSRSLPNSPARSTSPSPSRRLSESLEQMLKYCVNANVYRQ